MKKFTTKLALHRDTIRTLVDADLPRVLGGADANNCPAVTRAESGCSASLAADPVLGNAITKAG